MHLFLILSILLLIASIYIFINNSIYFIKSKPNSISIVTNGLKIGDKFDEIYIIYNDNSTESTTISKSPFNLTNVKIIKIKKKNKKHVNYDVGFLNRNNEIISIHNIDDPKTYNFILV